MKSLENLLLLVLCLLYLPFRGSARREIKYPKRVCIIQSAQFGDMICTTPVFRAIKEAYPDSKVYVVGKAINREVLRNNPDVEDFIVWKEKPFETIKEIRKLRCDFGASTGPNFVGLAILFLSGVKSIAAAEIKEGSSPLETRPYKILRNVAHVVPHIITAYPPKEYLKLLRPIGITSTDTTKHVYYSLEAKKSAEEKILTSPIGNRKFAIVVPGAGHYAKRWLPERFASVARHVASTYMPVAVIGGERDREDVAEMMKNVNHPDIVNFAEALSIDELKTFISLSSLFVSLDTGPLFIAEAFGVPTVCIIGPVDGVQPPRGPKNILIFPRRDRPAALAMFNTIRFDIEEAKRQSKATQVSEVIDAVDRLMAG
ncbi:MAG: hypothetical protein A3J09_00080 [Candidatus Zambryskibacteria bacterium RIFCSPLOWO2_02_FULL_51_21]|uniref:Glycosyl transferase family 9 n=1 Tax=Candidatus Zambryskibacteria bacterium RIFCSPHIGHO2_02_FULL_43_37 TaxID=1802749 RepID=A0A1G2TIG1_9BACT|nr:MAG: hypothetical protein A2723_00080 [Candidatus Zambryskibacteria bacterium RIFCSPHIGHO2_01_FULL_52_18]OHA96858.1 MAG: hypothetical protein A3D49_01980 [Candidatus Zambryskibacteria bacterium RIFCSPHIGHO2_02_FULL_43_37]OHB10970.1 MAG: hypothetical protein A3J09_00080 [Candidatus Zambryskibacteria bacterium RIFCSPLOWO2_02_FULL_51_21]